MPAVDLPADPPVAMEQSQAETFDLASLPRDSKTLDLRAVKPRCPVSTGKEIVVCAPDPEENRLRPLPDTYVVEEGMPRAQLGLGDGVTLDVHVDAAVMPDGTVSNRIMIGTKIKF